MAFVSDFAFNNISRLGDDSCSQDINTIENSQACSYLLQNYFVQDCTMSKAKQLAVTQPGVNYSNTHGHTVPSNASFDNLKNIGMQIMPSSEFKNKIIETVGPKPTNIPKYIEKYIPPESQWSKSDIQKAYDNYLSQPKNPREKYVPKQPNNGWTPK